MAIGRSAKFDAASINGRGSIGSPGRDIDNSANIGRGTNSSAGLASDSAVSIDGRGCIGSVPPSLPAEADISEANRRQIQEALRRLDYYKGPVDGIFGTLTRAAIRRFQHEMCARAEALHTTNDVLQAERDQARAEASVSLLALSEQLDAHEAEAAARRSAGILARIRAALRRE